MTDYNFGDIVLVPFPFTDQTTTKRRPAAVVSSSAYHAQRPDLVLMAVTSRIRSQTGFGELDITQWKDAGLIKPSITKPVITTIEKPMVLRKLGALHQTDRRALARLLLTILGQPTADSD